MTVRLCHVSTAGTWPVQDESRIKVPPQVGVGFLAARNNEEKNMQLKVLKAIPVWQSDDGTRTKFSVLTESGEIYSTWSKAIGQAEKGSEFDVVIEEREGLNGRKEKYVKQASTFREFGTRNSGEVKDTASIERQVALKCAVEFAASREKMKAADVVDLAEAFDKFLKQPKVKVAETEQEKMPWN